VLAFRDFCIQRKLLAIVMLTVGAALGFSFSAFLFYDLAAFRSTMKNDLSTLADIVGQNSTAALSFSDFEAAQQILGALRAKPNIVSATIYTYDGKTFATSDALTPRRPSRLPSPVPTRFASGSGV